MSIAPVTQTCTDGLIHSVRVSDCQWLQLHTQAQMDSSTVWLCFVVYACMDILYVPNGYKSGSFLVMLITKLCLLFSYAHGQRILKEQYTQYIHIQQDCKVRTHNNTKAKIVKIQIEVHITAHHALTTFLPHRQNTCAGQAQTWDRCDLRCLHGSPAWVFLGSMGG